MKAIVQERFGPPDVLQFVDIDAPEIGPDDVLVRVHAAALNPYDWHILRGDPYVARLMGTVGLTKPKAAGGRRRRRGARGGGRRRTCAACGPGTRCSAVSRARSPSTRAPERTGGAQAGEAHLRAGGGRARWRGRPPCARSGTSVRCRPGSGCWSTGRRAASAASPCRSRRRWARRSPGCAAPRNVELVRSLGAAHVIDYTQEDFTDGRVHYDVVQDSVGNQPLRRLRRALTPTGTLVTNAGGPPGGQRVRPDRRRSSACSPSTASSGSGSVRCRTSGRAEHLLAVIELIEAGKRHARHRPDLPAGRHGRGPALPRGGTRARQGRRHRDVSDYMSRLDGATRRRPRPRCVLRTGRGGRKGSVQAPSPMSEMTHRDSGHGSR